MDTKCYAGARENQVALDPEWLQSRVRAEQWDVFNEEQMCAALHPNAREFLRAESGEAVILAAGTDEIERTIALTNLRLERTRSIVLEGIYVRLIKLKNDAGQVEGHQVHRIARDHRKTLVGLSFHATSPNGRFSHGALQIDSKHLSRIEVHGKYMFYIFEDSMVQIHFGMAGNASTHTLPGPEPKSTTRLRLENEESEVCMLLSAMTVKIHGADEYDAISGKIGADPLRSDAEKTKFVERMRRSKKSIGMLLMDQSVIAGIGNIYRAEILFKAGVHPEEPASSLPEKLLDSVWFHSVDLLQRGFASGSIMTVDKNDNMPAPWNRRYIYNHEKCGVCAVKRGVDQAVQSWDINNRTVYACPNCQPLLDHSELDEERQNALSNASNAVPFHSKCARDADAALHEPNKMKVQELKDELAKRSLSTLGKKQVLVERLSEALNDDESETQERMQPQEANGKVQRDDPGSMKVQDLKEELKEHGENTTGKKAELVARLNAARGADAIKPGTEGLEMASAKEAYEEKVAAGEGRNVEHVALADDQTLQQQKSGKKRAASSKRKAATDTANNQVPFKRTKEQAAT